MPINLSNAQRKDSLQSIEQFLREELEQDVSELQAPFGGWKMSGIGRELGPEGLDAYLEQKLVKMRVRAITD